jgi:hypothetical protein
MGYAVAIWLLMCTLIFNGVGSTFFQTSQTDIPDWLITKINTPVQLVKLDNHTLQLTNGLISRTFTLSPDFGTIDFYSHYEEKSLLRTIHPEGFVFLDNIGYKIGCLEMTGEFTTSYLNRTSLQLACDPTAFRYHSHTTMNPSAPFKWQPGTRHSPKDISWPPKGLHLEVILFRL